MAKKNDVLKASGVPEHQQQAIRAEAAALNPVILALLQQIVAAAGPALLAWLQKLIEDRLKQTTT